MAFTIQRGPRITSIRPDVHHHDSGDARWRGGWVESVDGATSTVRLQADGPTVATYPVATTLIPSGAQSVRAPVACRVTGDNPSAYVIAEVVGSAFASSADARAVQDDGAFRPAIVPRSITNVPLYWWIEG